MTASRSLTPQSWVAKLLALVIFVFVVTSISKLAIMPTINVLVQKSKRNSQLEEAVSRYSSIIANQTTYQTALDEIRNNPLPKILYTAASSTSLGALVQNDVREVILQSGGVIDSMQSIQSLQEKGLEKAGVSIALRADISVLADVLTRIKSNEKLLSIENMVIRAPESQLETGQPMLTVRLDIFGYGTNEAGSQAN